METSALILKEKPSKDLSMILGKALFNDFGRDYGGADLIAKPDTFLSRGLKGANQFKILKMGTL